MLRMDERIEWREVQDWLSAVLETETVMRQDTTGLR